MHAATISFPCTTLNERMYSYAVPCAPISQCNTFLRGSPSYLPSSKGRPTSSFGSNTGHSEAQTRSLRPPSVHPLHDPRAPPPPRQLVRLGECIYCTSAGRISSGQVSPRSTRSDSLSPPADAFLRVQLIGFLRSRKGWTFHPVGGELMRMVHGVVLYPPRLTPIW